MIRKIRDWFRWRRFMNKKHNPWADATMDNLHPPVTYTREQMLRAIDLAFADGKRAGLEIAKQQAAKSFSEILRHQNK